MDVGFLFNIRRHPEEQRSLRQVYQDHIDDVVHAEQLGFTHAWAGEHHFAWDQATPGLFPVLAAVAQRTSRIRIGTHVTVLPYHHPLRVAEDAAVLDILSGGRFELTVGAGSFYEEFRSYDVDAAERFGRLFEGLDVILKCFTEDEFSHEGKYFTFPGVRMTTKPLQERLPVWVAASGPVGVKRVARRGLNVAGASAFGPQLMDLFDSGLRAHGHNPADHGSGLLSMVHVADDEDRAWAEAARGVHHWLTFLAGHEWVGLEFTGGSLDVPAPDRLRDWAAYSPIPYHVGTPDQVAESLLRRVRSARNTNLALSFRQVFMDTAVVHHSMDLFAEHVMPELRAWQHPTTTAASSDQ
ncbi:LLM class flavin-dependent oxidoreductase [Streptomyces hyaluromycini]|uniref:LLM class flavin-dependent oxidoreductase n=1 Tax=Streptomyces hyaluromycini TaxID=1377993 RepID=A0ABV1WVH6_9ACTN